MGQILSNILYRSTDEEIGFFCPGCRGMHIFKIRKPGEQSTPDIPSWTWNGSFDKPTFNPSLRIKTGHYVGNYPKPPNCVYCNEAKDENRPSFCEICHSTVTNGMITFHPDTTHKLSGQTVPIPSLPDYLLKQKS